MFSMRKTWTHEGGQLISAAALYKSTVFGTYCSHMRCTNRTTAKWSGLSSVPALAQWDLPFPVKHLCKGAPSGKTNYWGLPTCSANRAPRSIQSQVCNLACEAVECFKQWGVLQVSAGGLDIWMMLRNAVDDVIVRLHWCKGRRSVEEDRSNKRKISINGGNGFSWLSVHIICSFVTHIYIHTTYTITIEYTLKASNRICILTNHYQSI